MLATELARDIYRGMVGEEPLPVMPWRIEAVPHTGDPALPLYTVDRDAWRVTLYLHEGQMRAWESDSLYTFMLAGAQGGKTSFLPWLLARKILADMAAGSDGGDYLIATSTSQLFNSGFRPVILEVFEYVLGIARMWPSTDFFELRDPVTGEFWAHGAKDRMWGRILLRAAASRGALEGFTAKAAILDECGQDAFTMYAWDAVERRLDVHKAPIWAGTTLYNFGWLKQLIFDPWEDGKLPHLNVIQFPSVMNPAYPQERFEQKRAAMQPHHFRMQHEGKFERPAGAVFTDFVRAPRNEGGHLVPRFEPSREWARYHAVDPGIINACRLWAAHDEADDVYYVYRCLLGGPRLGSTEYAAADIELEARHGERVVKRAIGAKSEKYWREDYRRAGARGVTEPNTDSVEEGINRIVTLLRQHRIYFMDDMRDLIDELMDYSRETDEMGNATDKIRDKSSFHRVDALRYLCIQIVRPKRLYNVNVEVRSYV